jgi:peptidyl-prolyl cis-trans isomerase B (cyclophilin B)
LHKRGALAAARQPDQVNPQRRSSGSQFYIVHGRPFSKQELDQIENSIASAVPGFAYSDSVREAYMMDGGTPFLDMQYTVFGEIVEGFDVLDAIATTQTGNGDQPATKLTMTVTALPDYSPPAAGE